MMNLLDHWKIPKEYLKKANEENKKIENLLLERYLRKKRPFSTKLILPYHKIPVSLRNFLFRTLMKFKKDPCFPRWPIENIVEKLRYNLIEEIKRKIKKKVPYIGFWPNGKFGVVLTHDMDTKSSFSNIEKIREIEKRYNFKSSWNVIAKKYKINFEKLKKLKKEGCEIGSHGYNHDGCLPFLKESEIKKRLDYCLKVTNAKGFRSPQLQKTENFLKILDNYFVYDGSMTDTDIYSIVGVRSGCCTVFPYFINKIVELPLTIPQDYRLMYTLKLNNHQIMRILKNKIDYIKSVKGLVLINAHPDNYLSGSERGLKLYEKTLEYLSKYKTYHALPIEVAEWWKERHLSEIKKNRIIGSKRAKIEFI